MLCWLLLSATLALAGWPPCVCSLLRLFDESCNFLPFLKDFAPSAGFPCGRRASHWRSSKEGLSLELAFKHLLAKAPTFSTPCLESNIDPQLKASKGDLRLFLTSLHWHETLFGGTTTRTFPGAPQYRSTRGPWKGYWWETLLVTAPEWGEEVTVVHSSSTWNEEVWWRYETSWVQICVRWVHTLVMQTRAVLPSWKGYWLLTKS